MNNPQNNKKVQNNKGRGAGWNKTVVLLVLFCLCIGGISMVSAKYIKENTTKNNSATAKEFYFTSDLLDGKQHEITPTENNGKMANVTIRLKNHIDDLRYSETEIKYKVSVTEKDAETSSDTAEDVYIAYGTEESADVNGLYTLEAGKKEDVDVTLSNLQAGKTYTVTATTDNIYKKTLMGTIKVSEPDTKIYASLHDETQYIEVTVWTTDYAGTVNLKYGDIGLLPDNTDTKMKDASSKGGTITDNDWKANTSYVFRFFKSDANKEYKVTVNDKEVTVSEK